MQNLCHFDIVVSGVRYPASPIPLLFTPRTIEGSHPAFPVLLGFDAPTEFPAVSRGTKVIVPRFAAAVTWALEQGLVPFCVPLQPGRTPKEWVCDEIMPAPINLAITFPWGPALDGSGPEGTLGLSFPDGRIPVIHRAVPGPFVIEVADSPDLPPVPEDEQAIRLPDDSVQTPLFVRDSDAILVPQDGAIIAGVAQHYPDHAILVTDVARPGLRTRCFQVR